MEKGLELFFALFNNLAIFIALVVIYGLLIRKFPIASGIRRQMFMGISFGLFAIGSMLAKIPVAEGVIVDQRNAIVALSGLFAGPVAAMISAILAAAFRIHLGGLGTLSGVVGLILSVLGAVSIRYFYKSLDSSAKILKAALICTVVIMPGFLIYGEWPIGWVLMKKMALPYGTAIFLGIFLVGSLLIHEEERKKNEDARESTARELLESNERLRILFDQASDAIIVCDKTGKLIRVNDQATQLTGYDKENLMNLHVYDINQSLDRKQTIQMFQQLKPGNRTQFEAIYRRKDGSKFPVEITKVRLDTGIGAHYLSIIRDISKRMKREEEITHARTIAEQANNAKDEFLAVISHEMRTPLNPILGFASLMLETCKSERETTFLSKIIEAANRELELIDSILHYIRIDQKSIVISNHTFNVTKLCHEVFENHQFLENNVSYSFINGDSFSRVPENLLIISDRSMLQQVLSHLLGNAHKFTTSGIIEFSISLEERASDNDRIHFKIRDTGIGIAEEDQEKIFAPFTQVDSSYTRHFQGMGFGLAVSRKIVSHLGGEISVKSELGKGSEFSFYIPLRQAEKEILTTETDPSANRLLSEKHLLVVEDTPDNAELVNAYLKPTGCRITLVGNGQSAVEVCNKNKFDLILMDLAMPVMDGFEATRNIRQGNSANSKVPIIALTADLSTQVERRSLDAGITDVLYKPIRREKLIMAVNKY